MNEEFITIEVNAYGIKHSAILSESCEAKEFIEKCAMMAEAIGFNPQLVMEALHNSINIRI